MTLIKDPLSPENAEKLEEAAKDVSKAALVHHTAMQQDEIKIIIEERDLLYKENEIYHDSLERALEENKNLRTLIQGWKNSEVRERPPNLLSESPIGVVLFGSG